MKHIPKIYAIIYKNNLPGRINGIDTIFLKISLNIAYLAFHNYTSINLYQQLLSKMIDRVILWIMICILIIQFYTNASIHKCKIDSKKLFDMNSLIVEKLCILITLPFFLIKSYKLNFILSHLMKASEYLCKMFRINEIVFHLMFCVKCERKISN